jgi:hypothetical protein
LVAETTFKAVQDGRNRAYNKQEAYRDWAGKAFVQIALAAGLNLQDTREEAKQGLISGKLKL